MTTIDAYGNTLHEGDRVFVHEIDGKRQYGTLEHGETAIGQSWYVDYDDGESYILLDTNDLFKA